MGESRNEMLIGAIIAFCVLVFIAALPAPRLSAICSAAETSRSRRVSAGSKAPGVLGRWAQKPFGKSRNVSRAAQRVGVPARSSIRFIA